MAMAHVPPDDSTLGYKPRGLAGPLFSELDALGEALIDCDQLKLVELTTTLCNVRFGHGNAHVVEEVAARTIQLTGKHFFGVDGDPVLQEADEDHGSCEVEVGPRKLVGLLKSPWQVESLKENQDDLLRVVP
jgi:hypothetical protein